MTDQVKIRPARAADAENVLQMVIDHAVFEGESFDPSGKLEKLRAGLEKQQPFECLVVDVNGQLQGYCSYMAHYDSWHQGWFLFVDGLWLNEHVRGASIGTQIFDRLHKRANEMGCATIQVMTPSTNDSGIRFYKKLGAAQASKAYFSLPVKPSLDGAC
jgi:ribosomal protein S18 acetylase RimI-like enzyme